MTGCSIAKNYIQYYISNKNIEFITKIEGDITLNINLHCLSSTIDSLIINAIKYTDSQVESGGGVIPRSSSHKLNLTSCNKQTREKNTKEKDNEENKPQIVITLAKHTYRVEFTIMDQGVGIPKEELLSIFEPFTVSSKTRTRSGNIPNGQRGIGLTLCKLAIEAHGGTIKAESNATVGARFSFTLPYL